MRLENARINMFSRVLFQQETKSLHSIAMQVLLMGIVPEMVLSPAASKEAFDKFVKDVQVEVGRLNNICDTREKWVTDTIN
jgi:hypothetical protein